MRFAPLAPLRGEGLGVRGCGSVSHHSQFTQSLLNVLANHRQHLRSVSQYFIARNAHDSITLPRQKLIADLLSLLSALAKVIRSINLQNQF
jgi:hypothetical protein